MRLKRCSTAVAGHDRPHVCLQTNQEVKKAGAALRKPWANRCYQQPAGGLRDGGGMSESSLLRHFPITIYMIEQRFNGSGCRSGWNHLCKQPT